MKRATETDAAERLSREARAFAVSIFLSFSKAHPAVQAQLSGKDPAVWDFFVAIAAMGLACLNAPPARRKPLAKALQAVLGARHPDTARALSDFIGLAERANDPAEAAGMWILAHLTLRKPTPREAASARPLGALLLGRFQAWAR